MAKDLLRIADLTPGDLADLVGLAADIKHHPGRSGRPLAAELVVLYFTKPSTGTRITFSTAATRLGATVVMLGPAELRQGHSAMFNDIARFVGHYAAVVVAHADESELHRFAGRATVPVVNGLSPRDDPCQSIADLLTLREAFGSLDGLRIAYVGAGTPAAHSLVEACALTALDLRVATPVGHELDVDVVAAASVVAARTGGRVAITHDPIEAAEGADVVYTSPLSHLDLPASDQVARSYQETTRLIDRAAAHAVLLHTPSAHPGDGVAPELVRGPHARVREQVENRLPSAAAMLVAAQQGRLAHAVAPVLPLRSTDEPSPGNHE